MRIGIQGTFVGGKSNPSEVSLRRLLSLSSFSRTFEGMIRRLDLNSAFCSSSFGLATPAAESIVIDLP